MSRGRSRTQDVILEILRASIRPIATPDLYTLLLDRGLMNRAAPRKAQLNTLVRSCRSLERRGDIAGGEYEQDAFGRRVLHWCYRTTAEIALTAHHEAAHAVVFALARFRVVCASISPTDGTGGRVEVEGTITSRRLPAYCRGLLAGECGEVVLHSVSDLEPIPPGAAQDLSIFREMARGLVRQHVELADGSFRGRTEDEIDEAVQRIWDRESSKAMALVCKNWGAICAVAAELINTPSISGDRVREIIRNH